VKRGTHEVQGEPEYLFRERMLQAKEWLSSLPQQHVVVVAHWAVIRALTGVDSCNCEVRKVHISELLDEPCVDPDEQS
jgi:hypothetical protein